MAKYSYSRIKQNKAVLSCFNSGVYKYTTHTHKTQYKQNLSHYRAYQNKKQHTNRDAKPKTPTESRQKRQTTPENKNRTQEHTPTKRKSLTERKNARKAKRKAANG